MKLFWHVHPDPDTDVLLEPMTSSARKKLVKERDLCIQKYKSKKKLVEELKRMGKPVLGKLPPKFLEIAKTYLKGIQDYSKAFEAYKKAKGKEEKEKEEAFLKIREAVAMTEKVYDKAAKKDYKKQIEVLHKKECKNCSWC